MWRKSRTLKLLPKRAMPNAAMLLPKRPTLRRLIADPSMTKSNTLAELPKRESPKALNDNPQRP